MKADLKDRVADWLGALSAAPAALGTRGVQLRLPRGWPETDPSVQWWSATPLRGETAGHAENLAQLPDGVRAAALHVWTPAAETLLTRAQLPTRSRSRIQQALPYALEDQLLDEPEALHFAYVREADGALAVAVTQKARLNVWLEILKGAGLRPASLSPANLALPLYSQAWSVAFVGDELWLRTGEHAGFVAAAAGDAPPPLLATALKEATAQGRAPQSLVVFGVPPDFDAERWSSALQLPVVTETRDFWAAARPPALNLLQADFGRAAHLRQLLRPLRPAIAMLALWLLVTVAVDLTDWFRLRQAHRAYLAEMHDIYRQSFGTAAQRPYEQMKRGIETLQTRGGGPSDLLPLLTRVAPTLQTQAQRARLQGLKYAERTLTLELVLPDYQALDAVKNALASANLEVEVLAANGRGNEVDGRLQVRPRELRTAARPRS